ncbi:nuclear transport factor 2 family protein [Oxalobacteraceae sp. CFBP 13708]|nr:nuclear transport factor 2 family protein [Oxalobacteraceae sp. CFBP 13708]
MTIPMPAPVSDYFLHANAHDADAVAVCFSQDAEVRDEGHVYRGRDAIGAWKRATSARYGATAHPVSCEMTPPVVSSRPRSRETSPAAPRASSSISASTAQQSPPWPFAHEQTSTPPRRH